ncbi:MAG: hypothetical protein L0H26_12165, partial [Microlunatus sp.]|nr:hypothetical protein [Microlunatus sp.]
MSADTSSEGPEWVFDGHGRLYDLSQGSEIETYGAPPALRWVAPVDLPQVLGLRCARSARDRVIYDLRCASEVFRSDGGEFVNVVDEDQWYRWLATPE